METSLLWTAMTTDGLTDRVYHHVDMGEARPIRQPPRRLHLTKQADVGKMLEDMQQHGVIEESDSPWSSPVILRKKNNLSFCIDYRKLNNFIRKDCFPLSQIDNTLDTQAGAKWFSTLDLKSGYW
jgi:hypothetical protein